MLLIFSSLLIPYHKALLETARKLLGDGHPEVALIVNHMACEVYAEQVISAAFKKRGIEDLEGPVGELYSGSSLGNERVRELYVALTKDQIQAATFWSEYATSYKLRNKAIHSGERITKEQAQASCDVAAEFVAHLDSVVKTLVS